MSTHEQKVNTIVQLEPPKNIPTLQTFLGMMTYFSNYIPFYAWIAALLFKLLKKDKPWEWTQLEQEAFDVCKQALVSAPVMAYPIHGKLYRIYSDACDYGVAVSPQVVQPIKIADLKETKLYEKLQRAYDVKEPVPNLVTPI